MAKAEAAREEMVKAEKISVSYGNDNTLRNEKDKANDDDGEDEENVLPPAKRHTAKK